jgi:hypothetical protein
MIAGSTYIKPSCNIIGLGNMILIGMNGALRRSLSGGSEQLIGKLQVPTL